MAKDDHKKPRTPMPEQPAGERNGNFKEVALGYSVEQGRQEAARCLQCKKAPCVAGCPVEIDIPAFIKNIEDGDLDSAILTLKNRNSLPAVCGRVCPQEDQCEKVCTLNKKGNPVAIGRLERLAADYEAEKGEAGLPEIKPPTGKKVAVIGSGPAGLTCAGDLARAGHEVSPVRSPARSRRRAHLRHPRVPPPQEHRPPGGGLYLPAGS